jgi:hypothetical protein
LQQSEERIRGPRRSWILLQKNGKPLLWRIHPNQPHRSLPAEAPRISEYAPNAPLVDEFFDQILPVSLEYSCDFTLKNL